MAAGDKYTVIRTKRKELIGIIQRDPESVLDELLAQSVITEEEYDGINQLPDQAARIRKLLIYIQKRGESTCRDFLECLEILFPGSNQLLQPSEYETALGSIRSPSLHAHRNDYVRAASRESPHTKQDTHQFGCDLPFDFQTQRRDDFFNPERDSRSLRDPEPRERDFFNPKHPTELEKEDGFNPEQQSETQQDQEPEEKDGSNQEPDPQLEEEDGSNPEPDPQLEEDNGSNPEPDPQLEEDNGSNPEPDQEPEEENGSNPEQELETEPDPEPEGSNSEQESDTQ